MNKNCSICFDNIASGIKCCNFACENFICSDCMKDYIRISNEDSTIPRCVDSSCAREYLYESVIGKVDESSMETFLECFVKEYSADRNVENFILSKFSADRLRKSREMFIRERFPVTIQLCVDLCMEKKMKMIDKQNVTLKCMKNMKSNFRPKKCSNYFCKGYLNEKNVCLFCDTSFCAECSMIRNENHVCDPNILESNKFISEMVKCPNCKVPVEKSEGCNSMRCTNCDTNFMYDTGEMGGEGNTHNISHSIARSKPTLFSQYQDKLSAEDYARLVSYESKEPSYPRPISISVGMEIDKYNKDKNSHIHGYNISTIISKFNQEREKRIQYFRNLDALRRRFEQGDFRV